ncbi:MAG TPA: BlaI/MecI/CopY family transcriptional regulator [Kofleriaceae bacterium]|nr:BlaI/MecI/CopY family transcriptional regulator [Kofleriaceae bacterium]
MKRLRPVVLGALEERVMQILWDSDPLVVRDVVQKLGSRLAYTTVMTTLDRLHRKGLLARDKDGVAFVYRPALTRDDFHRKQVEATVGQLLAKSADPVLAGFVDAAAAVDEDNLARLEQLIAARRKARR